jgi:hypothetical protein
VHLAAPRTAEAPAWLAPLRAVLDQLHTLPDPRLAATPGAWAQVRSLALGEHRHGALVHRHGAQTAEAQDLGESPMTARRPGPPSFSRGCPGREPAGGAGPAGAVWPVAGLVRPLRCAAAAPPRA